MGLLRYDYCKYFAIFLLFSIVMMLARNCLDFTGSPFVTLTPAYSKPTSWLGFPPTLHQIKLIS